MLRQAGENLTHWPALDSARRAAATCMGRSEEPPVKGKSWRGCRRKTGHTGLAVDGAATISNTELRVLGTKSIVEAVEPFCKGKEREK